MAEGIWSIAGDVVRSILNEPEFSEYGLLITGHSLGAGVACLLNMMCHVDSLVGEERKVSCYAFAPPPTYSPYDSDATGDGKADPPALVKQAIQNCVSYIHDNDAVPFLSITSVRRLAHLLDTVDNKTEFIWFYDRWRIFHEYKSIPKDIFEDVADAKKREACQVDGECNMIIPARIIVWMKKHELSGKFDGYGCDPVLVAQNTVYVSPDMISDHLAEMHEDALDALLDDYDK